MSKKQAEELLRKNCSFQVSLRYELFYSLNALLDPNSRIHPSWVRAARVLVGDEFFAATAKLGGSWEVWAALPALMPGPMANPSYEEIVASLRALSLPTFQKKLLRGLIHSEGVLEPLLKGRLSLKGAIARVPAGKREWISHIGLFPYDSSSPQIIALEFLLAEPKLFREAILKGLEIYWRKVFKATWAGLEPQLRRSLEARERLFHSCSFAEFAKETLLRVEVKESKAQIKAIRGGYQLGFGEVEHCYFLPSAFNDRRFWSAFGEEGQTKTVYFPYFDPNLTVEVGGGENLDVAVKLPVADPALDPALIFRALGDSTRFAIAMLIARTPMASVELAKRLSVSKPTISHHVHVLREAGLLEETYANGSVELKLRRAALEKLSTLAISKFFENHEKLKLSRSRNQ